MEYFAHSAKGITPGQSYTEHIDNVIKMARQNALIASGYYSGNSDLLVILAEQCAYYHDLGKLETENQSVLHGSYSRTALPINHVDAGAAALKLSFPINFLPAAIVYSHHKGLPNFSEEGIRGKNCFRDQDLKIQKHTDKNLSYLLQIHRSLITNEIFSKKVEEIQGDPNVFVRILLSCLVDADHSDTARNYGKFPKISNEPRLRPKERLKKLDEYVRGFGQTKDERNRLRSEMYMSCRNSTIKENISACDSPVGSGKTTAIMAHLLNQAQKRRSRRIFVVLPFTNIISQSVEIYRKALVLPGEDPENVVAELHHRADFENEEARFLTAQWKAPIVVTTAVAFFETIASNYPSTLRRLHELPGSVIFVDEAHAAMPVKLMPLTWKWMQSFADDWGCYWVLASGSLVEFWTIEQIAKKKRIVPQIIQSALRDRLHAYENRRIEFPLISMPLSREDLKNNIVSSPGPRLLIMNTIQSAAVMARDFLIYYEKKYGNGVKNNRVFHLSTALSAEDRKKVIEAIKEKLANKNDTDWILVATSCVEAGIDFSFHTGFREISSLSSLLQSSGRINRNGEYQDSSVWSFSMQDDILINKNSAVEDSSNILSRYFYKREKISSALCTKALHDELNISAISSFTEKLDQAECSKDFEDVANQFIIIDSDTVPVIADNIIKNKIRNGKCDWRDLQKKVIMIHRKWIYKLNLTEIVRGIYEWNQAYSEFLGVMEGILVYLEKNIKSSSLTDTLIID